MNHVVYVKPAFRPDAFAGTATYYLRYRVPYPHALLRDLIQRAGVTGAGRLLDLACGPGRVALAVVSFFREVWAIDLRTRDDRGRAAGGTPTGRDQRYLDGGEG